MTELVLIERGSHIGAITATAIVATGAATRLGRLLEAFDEVLDRQYLLISHCLGRLIDSPS
jgi:hypothetical protein